MASEPDAAAAPAAPPTEKKETTGSFLRFLLLLFVATLLVRSLIFAPFSIPSGSMLPTLMIGDYLFVAKWPYGYSRFSFPFGIVSFPGRVAEGLPARGDVVVFRYPGGRDEDFVKRVIGLPGDTIETRGGALILNGQRVRRERIADLAVPVSENSPCRPVPGAPTRQVVAADGGQACAYPRFRETLPGGRSFETLDQVEATAEQCRQQPIGFPPCQADNFAQFTVPAGHVFVMGDNRDDSLDSRFSTAEGGVGPLPIDRLQGRALIGFFSTDGSAGLMPWTWFGATRWERIGQTYP